MVDSIVDGRVRVGSVTGRYVLGDASSVFGSHVFACRLRSVGADRFVAAAPVIGAVGEWVTASFSPFGTLHGRIAQHVADGFVVQLTSDQLERSRLARRIAAYRDRPWGSGAEQRVADRFMPAEPRSVMLLRKGKAHPCLVIDYSALGAAVSAAITPAIGTRLTIGQIPARVGRLFDVGFAVTFEPAPDAEDIERLLEAPAEWLNTVRVVAPQRIDTSEPGETLDVYGGD